jgi:hypothetical protein
VSAFGITPASNTIPLDAARQGVASFTVSNQLGRLVRVRASVTVTGDPAPDAGWFSGPDRSERELAADAADQFVVLLAVPEGVPGGTYSFRLDVVSVAVPEEEWAHGPEVTFDVPAPPEPEPPEPVPPPPPPPGYVETVGGAALGALVGGLGIGLIGLLAIFVAAGLPGPDDFGEAIGRIILLVILIVVFALLGIWVGSAVGIHLLLRTRGFAAPVQTSLPYAVILPFWAVAVLFVVSRLPNVDLPTIVGFLVVVLLVALVVIPPALAARAIYRFRTTGGL